MTQYQMKWVGYDSKHNIWEPIQHLAGCEDMIAWVSMDIHWIARALLTGLSIQLTAYTFLLTSINILLTLSGT